MQTRAYNKGNSAQQIRNLNTDNAARMKKTQDEFKDLFFTLGEAFDTDEPVIFSRFPDKAVKSSDPSFKLFSTFTFNQIEKEFELLIKPEEFKSEIFKKAGNLFGG
ncbi:hypothetical protein ACFL31_00055 [Candidatus Margulisiibacteriota bacterium]